jgi:hypothetical protein
MSTRSLTVWFVMTNHNYEGSDVWSVHRTQKGALATMERLREEMDRAEDARRNYWADDDQQGDGPVWPDGVPDCDEITVSGPWDVCK